MTRSESGGAGGGGKATHWGDVAEWYDRLVGGDGSEYHREVVVPGVLRMLQRREGERLRVLDLACGQGVLSRKLAAEGCEVVGVDAAVELIEAARRREEDDRLGIAYVVGDATKLLPLAADAASLAPASFDVVTVVLAIQNMTPLSPVWQACRALLKPGGSVVVVMMHPCFRVPRRSDWHWDEKTGTQSRTMSQYLGSEKIEITTHPGLAAHGKSAQSTVHFHRPLQAYVNTLGGAGLLVDHIEEWASHKKSQPGPRAKELDRARREVPMFLAVRARKIMEPQMDADGRG